MVAKDSILTALMFPWLAHGHVFPFLELAKKLSNKNFHIYFCSTAVNLDAVRNHLQNLHDEYQHIHLVELRLPSRYQLPPNYHTTKNVPPHLTQILMEAFQATRTNFSEIITTLNPDCLIFDTFQPWAAKAAASQNIPSVYFLTSGSAAFSFFQHLHNHTDGSTFPFYPSISLHDYEKRDQATQNATIIIKDAGDDEFAFGAFRLSQDIVLAKTCRGFEGKYMDYLSTLSGRKIVPTGPLITKPYVSRATSEPIMEWLDRKRPHSTLYISFGSENYLSGDQIRQLARGLELTRVDFIWVVRAPPTGTASVEDELPNGFAEHARATRRGMILREWAPQAEILMHRGVGGFMSHCGWSSVTESVYFGVPILGAPLKFDQPVNCRMVVDARVGVEVEREENGEFVGDKVARAIEQVIFGGERFRVRARELSKKMRMEEDEAVDEVADKLRKLVRAGRNGTVVNGGREVGWYRNIYGGKC